MLKFVVIALGIFIVYKLFANDFKHKSKAREEKEAKTMKKKKAAGELVKDPVCGTYVSLEDSITVRDGEAVHHFCSYECRDEFLKQLEQNGRELPEGARKEDEDDDDE